MLTFFYLEEFVFLFLRVNLFLENMRFVDVETFEKQPMIKWIATPHEVLFNLGLLWISLVFWRSVWKEFFFTISKILIRPF